jgi:hypothetical protein
MFKFGENDNFCYFNKNQELKFDSRACIIKLFTAVIYGFSLQARVFVPGKPFQPSLMFVGEARSLPYGAPEKCFTRVGSIRLGWQGLPGTNTLAYYENL